MAGFDPTQVPTSPVEIDWSHPLAQGLHTLVIPGTGIPGSLVSGIASVLSGCTLGGTNRGPAVIIPVVSGSPSITLPDFAPLTTTSMSVNVGFSNLSTNTDYNDLISITTATSLIVAEFEQPGTAGLAIYLISGSGYPSVNSSAAFPNMNFHVGSIVFDLAANLSAVYTDGVVTASGAQTVGEGVTGLQIGNRLGSANRSLAASYLFWSAYTVAQTAQQMQWLKAEPFAMLRPVRRRTYFVAGSSGATFSASIRAPRAFASVQFSAGESQTVAVTAKPARAAIVTAVGPGLTLTAADRKATAAASLTASDGLMASGSVQKTTAAISALSSLGLTAAPATHPTRAAISAEASAALALAAALDKATAALDFIVQGGADIMAIAASVGRAIAAIYAPIAVASGRSIAFLPSLRDVSFITSARAIYFSPRVTGDSEPFTADIAAVLLPGETLTALPTVACITGDLTIGAPSVSGTAITFGVSGAGTIGALSEITITIQTSNGRALNLAARVLTTPFIAGLPNPDLGLLAVPSPLFTDTRSENADEYEIDLTEWLADNEAIIAQSVACITGDLTVSGAAAVGPIVQWHASGPGILGAVSAFLVTVTTNQRGPVGFYCGVLTD